MSKIDRIALFKVLDAMEVELPDLESYIHMKSNHVIKTPLTLVYMLERGQKPIYKNEYDPAMKDIFVGILVEDVIFYAKKFPCSLANGKPLHLITGKDMVAVMPQAKFPDNAFLITEKEEILAYSHSQEWYETYRILADRHWDIGDVHDTGHYIEIKENGSALIFYPSADTYYSFEEYSKFGDLVVCSPKI